MHAALGLIVLSALGVLALLVGVSALAFRLEPEAQVLRSLERVLGRRPDAALVSPERRQGLGVAAAAGVVGVIRGPGDSGLAFDLAEVLGIELIFDDAVAARLFRGEPRKPLERIEPDARRVLLRLVFDDLATPEFEIALLLPSDLAARRPPVPAEKVLLGRRWYARLEAVVRRGASGSEAAASRSGEE